MRVRLFSVGVLTIFLIAILPGAPADAETDECVIKEVAGLGPACELDSGLFEVFDKEGNSLGTTHGPDPLPPSGEEPIRLSYSKPPACAQEPDQGYFTRVVYAWASDRSPTKSDSQIRQLVNEANGILYLESYYEGGVRDVRVQCELHVGVGLKTIIERAELPTRLSDTTFSSVVSDLQNHAQLDNMQDEDLHYWVYFEDRIACGCSGTGHLVTDDTKGVNNANNGGYFGTYAVTFGYMWPSTMIHELTHNMGGVQYHSPNSSGDGGHCNDGYDIMCYSDGGDKSNYRTGHCSWEQYDCGNDDYFAIDPPAGSYLARNWNIGDVEHRFLRGCGEGQGTLGVGAGPVELTSPRTYQYHSFSRTCSDRPFYIEGYGQDFNVRPLEEEGIDYPNQADMDVCFYDGLQLLECYDMFGKVEQGRTPVGTDRAKVSAKGGNAIDYWLRIG